MDQPKTWHQLIGYRRNGAPIYLHRGGSGPAGEGQQGGQGQQGGTGGQGGQQGGAGQGQQGAGQQGGGGEFTAPKDQAELDRIIGERLARERAKFPDYDEYKRKAGEFDKATEAQKTDLEKATGKATEAEAKATAAERRALVAEVALEKGLTASQAKRLVGNTRDELVADAAELLKDLGSSKGGGNAGGSGTTNFDAGNQGGTVKPARGEAGKAAAQKRYPQAASTKT